MTLSPSAKANWKQPRAILTAFHLVTGLLLLAASLAVWAASSTPPRSLSGISIPWLVLGLIGILFGLTFAWLAWRTWRDPSWANASWDFLFAHNPSARWIRWGGLLLFAISASLACLPAYRFQNSQIIFVRFYPFVAWLAIFSGLTLFLSLLAQFQFQASNAAQTLRARGQAFLIALALFISALVLRGLYLWGLSSHYEEYAYGAGVPVLGWQILLSVAAAIGFYFLERTGFLLRFKRADLWIGLVIWVITALLWVRQPATSSYFNPGPYLPNREYYPFSDAAMFDTGSQYLLIGEGLNAGNLFERPLYMQALVFLHMAAGQNYNDVANLQVILLAIMAVFLYWIGRELAGRPLGIGLSLLLALRGVNSIFSASIVDLASPKQLLTDFPTAAGIALLTYLTIKWLKRPAENRLFIFWASGLVALISLTRTNGLLLFIPIILLVWIVYRRDLRAAIGLPILMFALFLVSIYPWGISSDRSILEVYYLKFRAVLEQRYHFQFSKPDAMLPGSSALMMSPIAVQPELEKGPPGVGFIVQGLYHNLQNSFLILPASPQWHELRYTLKSAYPYWDRTWDGSFPPGQAAFLLLQLGLLSFGVGMAWKRARLAGLVPLFFFLAYQLSNTLGRTSGGRYIVPVDWVVLVYYLLGCIEIIYWVRDAFSPTPLTEESIPSLPMDQFHWSPRSFPVKAIGVMAFLVFIGLTPSMTESLFPVRYSDEQKAASLVTLETNGDLQSAGLTSAQVDAFLQQPSATLSYGRVLYPRYYNANKGEPDTAYPFRTLAYPRLAFRLLTQNNNPGVILPIGRISKFPNGADALILGCEDSGTGTNYAYLNALVIFLTDANGKTSVYTREPPAPLQCPAPEVVCDQKNECRSVN